MLCGLEVNHSTDLVALCHRLSDMFICSFKAFAREISTVSLHT